MKHLKERWGKFLKVALSPGSVVFVILTIGSLAFSFLFQENQELSILLAVLGSILGALAGSFIKDDYNKLIGENALEKKGRSAVRNLESIEIQVRQIKEWIKSFKNVGKEGKRALDETGRHLSTIDLNIHAGVEDWNDIVPELREKVATVKKYEGVLRTYVDELLKNKKELILSEDEAKIDKFKKKISNLERQIKDLRKDQFPSLGIGISGSSTIFPVLGHTRACLNCGEFLETKVDPFSPIAENAYCDKCQKKF